MSFPIIIANRFAKIIGTLVKTLSYPFHFVFPKMRFTIPIKSNPIIKSKRDTQIPKRIWQTNYTNKVSLPVYINYLYNRLMSLDYEYNYVSTEDRIIFIDENASKELSEAYQQLTDGASQADFWRIFTLNFYGGIYMDIDAHLVWPLSKIIEDNNEVFLLTKKHYSNYFIASRKDSPILEKALDIMLENIKNKNIEGGVYQLTGPTVLNTAIGGIEVHNRLYKYTCIQGSFTNERFQYIDKPRGKWIHAKREDLLKK
ncbi:glycosyltransferase family 32 protein [Sulfurimonas sp.]|jgi:mannosyltransferase OCH1-like enzyme|uniref:glycosyltransferase family 32 protein n=1 Tax=Sulfurimonas sp. TaxID=2022749 RepID=UPI0025D81258|nr:glycosyltransferase [Sulfurimonas sp.]MBT5934244.1 glycosyl transferase [Sulfurimonas sp.]